MKVHTDTDEIKALLRQVKDPEVPVIDIAELGVLRDVRYEGDTVVVDITPTYSGCPAMLAITRDIESVLQRHGITSFRVRTVLSPAWTTDWLTEEARQKLIDYGIAAPGTTAEALTLARQGVKKKVQCPFCKSDDTRLTSAFGSTACKALHYCNHCQQPFEEFKCH